MGDTLLKEYSMAFHDDKLWQAAYVSALDVVDASDTGEGNVVMRKAAKASLKVLTTIADGLSRRDRREKEMKLRDSVGLIAATRSLLSVAWAQKTITDAQFGTLDGAYEALSKQINR